MKELHREAMRNADLAHAARREGDGERAHTLFSEAFRLEREAAGQLVNRPDAEPSRSILYRSAATLALRCGEYGEAERLVCAALAGNAPPDIAEELRDLFEQINFHRHLALRGITLSTDEVQMSFAGNGIGYGIAPTEEVLDRVDRAQNMLYRVAERKLQRPYREHGQPSKEVKDSVSLYMTVPRAASFAVSFLVGGKQQVLPGMSAAESIIDEVIECLDLFVKGEEDVLRQKIPDEAYYTNFVGLAKAISPDGQDVSTVGFTALRSGKERTVALKPRRPKEPQPKLPPGGEPDKTAETQKPETTVIGTLRFADSLERREPRIKLIDDAGTRHTIVVPTGMMDDIVRPLWGVRVVVSGYSVRGHIVLTEIDRAPENA